MTVRVALAIVLLFVSCTALLAQPRRDRAGDRLPDGAVARFGNGRLLHGGVKHAEFSPDGRTVATSGEDGARLWDAATGKDVSPPYLPRTGSVIVAFTPVGEHVVGDRRGCRVIDPATGKVRCSWRNPERRPVAIVVAADGKSAATAWTEGGVTIHNLDGSGLRPGRTLSDQKAGVLALSGDGGRLAFAEVRAHAVGLWDVRTGKHLHTYVPAKKDDSLHALALSRDGRRLATAWYGKVDLWDTTTQKAINRGSSDGQVYPVFLRFSADGTHLDGASPYQEFFRWDAATGKQLVHSRAPKTAGEQYWVNTLSPDSRTYVGVLWTAIQMRDTETWKARVPIERWPRLSDVVFLEPTTAAVISPEEKEATVAVWDVTDGHLLRKHVVGPLPADWSEPVLSPDGKLLAAGNNKLGVLLFDVATGKQLRQIKPSSRDDLRVQYAFSPDSKVLVTSHSPRALRLWDVATGKAIARLEGDSDGPQAFSPDGRTIASGFVSPFYLTEVSTGKVRFTVPMADSVARERSGSAVDRIRFSRDGRKVATFARADIYVFSTDRGQVLLHLADEGLALGCEGPGTLSPDSRWLVHAIYPAGHLAVRDLHRPAATHEWQTLAGHANYVNGAEFSPDGKYLVTCGNDGTALVWDATKLTGRPTPLEADAPETGAGEARVPADWLEEQWKLLGDADAALAARVLVALTEVPDAAVAHAEGKLKPARAVQAKRIQRLVAALDSEDYAERQGAIKDLRTIIDQAAPALRKALDDRPSAEMKRNIEQLLAVLGPPLTDPDRLREVRAVELLERIGTPAARAVLERLAAGAPVARLTEEAKAALGRWR